jgi:hypothetical protein
LSFLALPFTKDLLLGLVNKLKGDIWSSRVLLHRQAWWAWEFQLVEKFTTMVPVAKKGSKGVGCLEGGEQ